jgi:hypothetical protein
LTFRITDFASVSITQVVDIRTPGNRYKRSRVEGNQKSYWMIELTTALLPYAEGMAAAAYLDSLKGSLEIIQFPCPLPELATRTGLTNTTANNSGTKSASISGFNNNLNSAVRAGDFLQYSNHQKVYRAVDNQNANGSGQLNVTITPELFKTTTQNETIKYGNNVSFQCCLEDYVSMNVSASNGKSIVFDITLVEQG